MRRFVFVLAVSAVFALTAANAGDGGTFFNGKDFAGWEGLLLQDMDRSSLRRAGVLRRFSGE